MSRLRYRVFVSSPGDVGVERRIATRVLERLQGRFGALVEIAPIFWEHEPVRVTSTFQDQISPPAESDALICILWSRLGTRLPKGFRRTDGSPYESGTAFELESASQAFEQMGRPDVLVYRKTAQPVVDVRDQAQRERRARDWDVLAAYLDTWFRNPDGSFKAGFTAFEHPDEFEEKLERHLERLILDRLAEENVFENVDNSGEVIWFEGSPFRGLEVFEPEHVDIFHGRTRAITEAKDRLARCAANGSAFLLIYGMSGSGKSSLVRAGILPTITEPGVVEGIALWRYAILRPSQGVDLLQTLISALSAQTALPELADGDFTEQELCTLVRDSPQRVLGPVRRAIKHAAERLQKTEMLSGLPEARLAIVVDQLEELFTDERIAESAREGFVDALAALARSGSAWVICTIRSDLYHRCSELPTLVELKDGFGNYELLPPTTVEIAQIIRNPAQAAGLRFETDPDEGRLDDVLLQAATHDPGSLPLLEFVLDGLYRSIDKGRMLTFAAYRGMGQLDGAIAQRADQVMAQLPRSIQRALPAVLRLLVVIRPEEGTVTAGVASLSQVRRQPQAGKLVDALVSERLFVTDGGADDALVRVAHEALLSHWPTAQVIIRGSRDDLLVRQRIEADASLWTRNDRNAGLLLPPGKRLAEASDLIGRHRIELAPDIIDFIQSSVSADMRRRRNRTSVIAAVFIVLCGLLGVTVWQWLQAREQTQIAQHQADLALSRQLATHAEEQLAKQNHQLALLLAAEAFDRQNTKEARAALKAVFEARPVLEKTLWLPPGSHALAAFSPDGKQLAVYQRRARGTPTLVIFDVATGKEDSWEVGYDLRNLAWGSQLVAVPSSEPALLMFDGTGDHRRLPLPPQCDYRIHSLGAARDATVTVACDSDLMRFDKRDGEWKTVRIDVRSAVRTLSVDGYRALDSAGPSMRNLKDGRATALRLETGRDKPYFTSRMALDGTGGRVAGFWEGEILVWSIDGPSVPLIRLPAQGAQETFVFSHDGSRLATVNRRGRVELWRTGQVSPLVEPIASKREDDKVAALALSPDRRHLTVGSETGLLTIRDLSAASKGAQVLSGWRGPVLGGGFLKGSESSSASAQDAVVVLNEGNGLVLRRVVDGEQVSKPVEVNGRVLATSMAPEGRVWVMSNLGRVVRIEELMTGDSTEFQFMAEDSANLVANLNMAGGAFSADGRYAALYMGGRLWFFDLVQKDRRFPPKTLEIDGEYFDFRPILKIASTEPPLFFVGLGGRKYSNPVFVWSPGEDSPFELWRGDHRYDDLFDLEIARDGSRIAAAALHEIKAWIRNGDTWEELKIESGIKGHDIAFDMDGQSLILAQDPINKSGNTANELYRYDLQTDKSEKLQWFSGGAGVLLEQDRSGRLLIAASGRDANLWDLGDGEQIGQRYNHFPRGVLNLVFDADSRSLIGADRRKRVRWVFDSSAGEWSQASEVNKGPARRPCTMSVETSYEHDLKLRPMPGYELEQCAGVVDKQGTPLMVGMRGGWAIAWEPTTGNWKELACRQAGRNLTAREWAEYVGESVEHRRLCSEYPFLDDRKVLGEK